jgi:hypothetical protein
MKFQATHVCTCSYPMNFYRIQLHLSIARRNTSYYAYFSVSIAFQETKRISTTSRYKVKAPNVSVLSSRCTASAA